VTTQRTRYPVRFTDRPILAQRAPITPIEALIQGRLDDIYTDVQAGEARRAAARQAARQGAPPGPAHERLGALRIRIGHGLVAVGVAVAGEKARAHDRPAA
jgi:hypothetical protein